MTSRAQKIKYDFVTTASRPSKKLEKPGKLEKREKPEKLEKPEKRFITAVVLLIFNLIYKYSEFSI